MLIVQIGWQNAHGQTLGILPYICILNRQWTFLALKAQSQNTMRAVATL
jgi:hypothetical protein